MPAFFEATHGGRRLVAAARFGDAREADLQEASSADPGSAAVTRLRQLATDPDPLLPLWLLAVGALVVADAWAQQRR